MIQAGAGRPFGEALEKITKALSGLGTGWTSDAVLAVVAAGVIAAAVVQLVKELTPLRRVYQKKWVQRWIYGRAHEDNDHVARAEQQLIHLATGGCANAFYELPAEEMALHINQVGQITLDAPDVYDVLLFVLANGVSSTDVGVIQQGQPVSGSTQQYFDARNRVARRIQRNVEGLRLALGRDWRFWMQLASVAMTTLIVTGTVAYAERWNWSLIWLALPIGIIGGYFAPITHDLAVAIQKLRKRLP